jgi:hypothetical protein
MTQERREYDTGAVRSADCETARYDLISPIGLRALAQTYAEGAEKFGYFNWEQGMPVADLLNHAITHIYNFLGGDRSEEHLAHAAWNLLGAIHSLEKWPHLNDAWLRGPGCSAPPIATQPTSAQSNTEIAIEPVAEGVYAVDFRDSNAADQLEKLRKAILEKKSE